MLTSRAAQQATGGTCSIKAAVLPTLQDIYMTTYRSPLAETTITLTAWTGSLTSGLTLRTEHTDPAKNMSLSQHPTSHQLPFFWVFRLCNKSKGRFMKTTDIIKMDAQHTNALQTDIFLTEMFQSLTIRRWYDVPTPQNHCQNQSRSRKATTVVRLATMYTSHATPYHLSTYLLTSHV